MPGSRSAGAGGCPHRAVADRGCCRSSLHFSCSFPTAVTDELSQAREGAVGSDAVMFELVGHPVRRAAHSGQCVQLELGVHVHVVVEDRSEERRVGKRVKMWVGGGSVRRTKKGKARSRD